MSDEPQQKGYRIPSYRPKLTAETDAEARDVNARRAMADSLESLKSLPKPSPRSRLMDGEDAETLFRFFMQMARYLAKKYGFTIKQWPER